MVQVIQMPRPLSGILGQQVGEGLGKLNQSMQQQKQFQQQQQQQQQNQGVLSRALYGEASPQEISSLPVDLQIQLAKIQQENDKIQSTQNIANQKQQSMQQKDQEKLNQKIIPAQQALQTVERMRQLGSEGNLGRGSAIKGLFGGKTAKDRAEYEQLGKSLISFATNIPIRNRIEFETLAEQLYDPSIPDQARAGILDAMQRIIQGSLEGVQGNHIPSQSEHISPNIPGQNNQAQKPPLKSFYR